MLARWGARYLVRGGEVEVLEGEWDHHTVVILEFPSRVAAEEFYESEEYAPLLKLRLDSTNFILAIMSGTDALYRTLSRRTRQVIAGECLASM